MLQDLTGQSAGQCGPCRFGLPDLSRAMAAMAGGSGGGSALDTGRRRGPRQGRVRAPRRHSPVRGLRGRDVRRGCHRTPAAGRVRQPVLNVLPLPASENPTGHRLAVDWARCDGHGLCGHLAPELIRLDGNGYPSFADPPVPVWLEASARKAVAMCPALALRLTRGSHEKRPAATAGGRRSASRA